MKTGRCPWAKSDLMIHYHDTEWGVPVHDDRLLFEHLVLDGAQAGLSWEIVLRKRDAYRAAFARFDVAAVAKFDARQVKQLLANPGIIRNRLKVQSAVRNARCFLAVQKEFGTFDAYIWSFTGGKTIVNKQRSLKQLPARSAESDAMSAGLKQRGFNFVGSTICYAFMQASGMVNDHLVACPRYEVVENRR